jgi:hypothetical protein
MATWRVHSALTNFRKDESMSKAWFGPKKFGFGFTPISWEGWACTFLIVLAVTALAVWFS